MYVYIYIYIYIYKLYISLGDHKSCLTLVVKIESLQSTTKRQNICH